MPELRNKQGLTPEEMSLKTENEMKRSTMSQSAQNPNQLIEGGQLGAVDGTPITYQAYTRNPINSLVPEPSSDSSLTSTEANQFTSNVQNDVSTRSTTLLNELSSLQRPGANQAEVDRISGQTELATNPITGQPDEEYTKLKKELDLAGARGFSTTIPQQLLNQYLDKARVTQQNAPTKERLTEQQRQEKATSDTAAFRSGITGTNYGNAYLQGVQEEHDRQLLEYNRAEQSQLDQLNAIFVGGQIKQESDVLQRVSDIYSEITKIQEEKTKAQDDYLKNQKAILEMQKLEREMGKAAEEDAGVMLTNLAKLGSEPTNEQFSYIDSKYGLDKGTSAILFGVSKQEEEIAQQERESKIAMDQEELIAKKRSNMESYLNIADKVGAAIPITIGDTTMIYQGMDTSGLKSGVEINDEGKATYWQVNPKTREVETVDMGYMGSQKGWTVQKDDSGTLWRVNGQTGAMQPMSPSQSGQYSRSWDTFTPTEQRGSAFSDPASPYLGECAYEARQCYADEYRTGENAVYWGNTIQEKQAKLAELKKQGLSIDASETNINNLEIGMTGIMKAGTTGHVFLISDIYQNNQDGKVYIRRKESNMVPPGGGQWSNSETMAIDDPRLIGFANIPLRIEMQTGSSVQNGGYGNMPTGFGVFGGTTTEETKPLTPAELDFWEKNGYEVKPGDTVADIKKQAPEKKKDPMTIYLEEQSNQLVNNIDNALKLLNTGTTGFWGWAKHSVPGTDSYNLSKALEAVGANIGFDQLSAMRSASPTGGALGSITERELAYLQSVQGSIDQFQDTDLLRNTLLKIKTSATTMQNDIKNADQTIRVRLKSTGETGTIPANEFNESEYEKL